MYMSGIWLPGSHHAFPITDPNVILWSLLFDVISHEITICNQTLHCLCPKENYWKIIDKNYGQQHTLCIGTENWQANWYLAEGMQHKTAPGISCLDCWRTLLCPTYSALVCVDSVVLRTDSQISNLADITLQKWLRVRAHPCGLWPVCADKHGLCLMSTSKYYLLILVQTFVRASPC